VMVSPSSDAAIQQARSPYEFCPDDDDNQTTVNAVLPATHDFLLFTAHALTETDIASTQAVTAVLSISQDPELHTAITKGYKMDTWCKKLQDAVPGMPSVQKQGDLLFIGECLVIPSTSNICKSL